MRLDARHDMTNTENLIPSKIDEIYATLKN